MSDAIIIISFQRAGPRNAGRCDDQMIDDTNQQTGQVLCSDRQLFLAAAVVIISKKAGSTPSSSAPGDRNPFQAANCK